jgi:hypothetical protein
MKFKIALWFVFSMILLAFENPGFAVERLQSFDGINIAQIANPGCVGLRIQYKGKLSSEKKLQAFVDINGARGIFDMDRESEQHRLILTSCPISCQQQRSIQKLCTDRPNEMRKVFYYAMANGRPTPWFVELAFIGEGESHDENSHDNYSFYFP